MFYEIIIKFCIFKSNVVSCEQRMEFIDYELRKRYPDYRSDLFELDAIVELITYL